MRHSSIYAGSLAILTALCNRRAMRGVVGGFARTGLGVSLKNLGCQHPWTARLESD